MLQERIQSQKTEAFIEHKPIHRNLINTHALHNAHLIRAILPRDLTVPIPYASNRRAHHDKIATKLQASQAAKRTTTAQKAEERRALKKATISSNKRKHIDRPDSDSGEDPSQGKQQEQDGGAGGMMEIDVDDDLSDAMN